LFVEENMNSVFDERFFKELESRDKEYPWDLQGLYLERKEDKRE